MKDKWTDLAAGRLGPTGAQEPAPDGSPDGRRSGSASAAGNYGIGRLGIVPAKAEPAAPARQPIASQAESGAEVKSAESAPVRRVAPLRRVRPMSSASVAPAPPRMDRAAPPAKPALSSVLRRAWREITSRPKWAACAGGVAVLCGVLGFVLLKSGSGGAPQTASAQAVKVPSAGSEQVPAANAGSTAAPQPAPRGTGIPDPVSRGPVVRSVGAPPGALVPAVPPASGTPLMPRETAALPTPSPAAPEPPTLAPAAAEFLASVRAELENWSRPPSRRPPEVESPAASSEPSAASKAGTSDSPPPAKGAGDNNQENGTGVVRPTPAAPARPVRNVGYSNLSGAVVSAILRGPEGPVAVINNELCKPGATVGKSTVVRIGDAEVEFEENGQRFLVSVSSTVLAPPSTTTHPPGAE